MKERRVSPRNRCPISLTYRILDDQAYRELMEVFDDKRDRMVLYDELEFKNTIVRQRLEKLDNELTPILDAINDQLKALTRTLSMNFDALLAQENSEVVINLGGMLFQTQDELRPGSIMEMQLKLSAEVPRLLIVAEVLRCEQNKDRFTTVIAFTYIEPEDKTVLREFVEQHLKDDIQSNRLGKIAIW